MSSESGVLDDIVGGADNEDDSLLQNSSGSALSSIRTRQRKRGSFVVATAPPPRPKKRSDGIFPKRLSTTNIFPASSGVKRQSPIQQQQQPKTPTEIAVLKDCVANHFLLACNKTKKNDSDDGDDLMLEALVARFEKVTLRTNEILYSEGDAAESLFVLYRGEVSLRSQSDNDKCVDENDAIGENDDDDEEEDAEKYKIFGELELMTNSLAYKATSKAVSDPCVVFSLSKADFSSYFLPHQHQKSSRRRLSVVQLEEEGRLFGILKESLPQELKSVFFPDDDDDGDDSQNHKELWKQVLKERRIRNFRKGDVLIHKTKPVNSLVMITDGVVRATDNSAGGRSYEDLWIGEGKDRKSFGWQSVLKKMSSTKSKRKFMTGTIRAETDGTAVVISKESFQQVFSHLGYMDGRLDVADLRLRRWKRTQLQQIMVFRDSGLNATQVNGLLDLMHPCEYSQNETIISSGTMVDVAMYFVREGSVKLELNRGRDTKTIERGGYFGEKNMLLDQNKSESDKSYRQRNTITAKAMSPETRVDVLYLEECAKIVNTTTLGLGTNSNINSIDSSVKWADLKRHKLIGRGSYGHVWICSATEKRYFALKVQAKYPLWQRGHADRMIGERNVMAGLNSPFVMRLFNSFQDEHRLYMVTSLLPGGELESAIPKNGFSETNAKFYAAGVLEGLAYMHRKHILHRDVKPENVLLNAKGYPVLIDLGFAKYVPEKTYTFCGSPLFMAPEIILHKGQTKGVDHWSWAVLVYRLVTAKYPFYKNGMDEMALYKRICKGTFEIHGEMSVEFRMLMISILYPEPTQRLGSRANGWRDIFDAPWFATVDLAQLRKQILPAPIVPPKADIDPESFIHQSSEDDLFDNNVCGKIPDKQQHIFEAFGSQVSTPIGGV